MTKTTTGTGMTNAIQMGDVTLHQRKASGTTFINLVRSGRTASLLGWRSSAEGVAPIHTSDSSALVVYADTKCELPDILEKGKEYVLLGDCSIYPKKNWAIVFLHPDLFELADVSYVHAIPPGMEHIPEFRVRPRKKMDRDELLGTAFAHVTLIQ